MTNGLARQVDFSPENPIAAAAAAGGIFKWCGGRLLVNELDIASGSDVEIGGTEGSSIEVWWWHL